MKFVDIKVMNCVDTGIEYISNELYWYKSYEQYWFILWVMNCFDIMKNWLWYKGYEQYWYNSDQLYWNESYELQTSLIIFQ